MLLGFEPTTFVIWVTPITTRTGLPPWVKDVWMTVVLPSCWKSTPSSLRTSRFEFSVGRKVWIRESADVEMTPLRREKNTQKATKYFCPILVSSILGKCTTAAVDDTTSRHSVLVIALFANTIGLFSPFFKGSIVRTVDKRFVTSHQRIIPVGTVAVDNDNHCNFISVNLFKILYFTKSVLWNFLSLISLLLLVNLGHYGKVILKESTTTRSTLLLRQTLAEKTFALKRQF